MNSVSYGFYWDVNLLYICFYCEQALSNEAAGAGAVDMHRVSARFRPLSVSRAAGQTGLPSYRLADAFPLLLPTTALFMFIYCGKSFTSVKCSENEIGR